MEHEGVYQVTAGMSAQRLPDTVGAGSTENQGGPGRTVDGGSGGSVEYIEVTRLPADPRILSLCRDVAAGEIAPEVAAEWLTNYVDWVAAQALAGWVLLEGRTV